MRPQDKRLPLYRRVPHIQSHQRLGSEDRTEPVLGKKGDILIYVPWGSSDRKKGRKKSKPQSLTQGFPHQSSMVWTWQQAPGAVWTCSPASAVQPLGHPQEKPSTSARKGRVTKDPSVANAVLNITKTNITVISHCRSLEAIIPKYPSRFQADTPCFTWSSWRRIFTSLQWTVSQKSSVKVTEVLLSLKINTVGRLQWELCVSGGRIWLSMVTEWNMDEFILDSVIHQVLSEFIMVVERQQVSHTMHLCTQQFSNDYLLYGVIHPQLRFNSRIHRCAFLPSG